MLGKPPRSALAAQSYAASTDRAARDRFHDDLTQDRMIAFECLDCSSFGRDDHAAKPDETQTGKLEGAGLPRAQYRLR